MWFPLERPYFKIRSYFEVLGARISIWTLERHINPGVGESPLCGACGPHKPQTPRFPLKISLPIFCHAFPTCMCVSPVLCLCPLSHLIMSFSAGRDHILVIFVCSSQTMLCRLEVLNTIEKHFPGLYLKQTQCFTCVPSSPLFHL